MAKLKKECCETYKKGKKPCKGCPVMAALPKKERKKLVKSYRKKKKKKKKRKMALADPGD